jgi:electron transfer flavoprotein beta subunit
VKLIVPVRQVPDVVEDLELTPDASDVDRELVKFVVNEYDEQALEEALCIKETSGAEVVVVGLDEPDVDRSLFGALAKGADRAVKLLGTGEGWLDGHRRSAVLAAWLAGESYDLVLTGVQAADELDGQLPTLLGARLGLPHVSVVVRVDVEAPAARVRQELAGGTVVEEEVTLPAVIGVQAARQAPRYVSIGRIRQAQQSRAVEAVPAPSAGAGCPAGFRLRRLLLPERAAHAEMLSGGPGEVAGRIVELIRARGLIES